MKRRFLVLVALLVVAVVIAASASMHGTVEATVAAISGVIDRHPFLGGAAFVGLAALSAMLAFFSSALVVPVGVHHWGEPVTFLLLWLGWLAGGAVTYALGRFVGGQVLGVLINPERAAYYQARISRRASFGLVLLFQLAVPSEIPGYVLGTAGYSFPRYGTALALAELPYAAGAVYLGSSFLRRQYGWIVLLGAAGIAFIAWAVARLHRSLSSSPPR
jgi:uncharacterized membrane protein YdjX (TVP38/TMEM64 family)